MSQRSLSSFPRRKHKFRGHTAVLMSLCKLLPVCMYLAFGYQWPDSFITEILPLILVGGEIWNELFSPQTSATLFLRIVTGKLEQAFSEVFHMPYERLETLLVNHSDVGIYHPASLLLDFPTEPNCSLCKALYWVLKCLYFVTVIS